MPTILGRNMTMLSRKIVKVTKTEFEMEDGTIHPILFDLEETPTVEDFQKHYAISTRLSTTSGRHGSPKDVLASRSSRARRTVSAASD
jgi:hypothetical protein